jgi:hypothetical protein
LRLDATTAASVAAAAAGLFKLRDLLSDGNPVTSAVAESAGLLSRLLETMGKSIGILSESESGPDSSISDESMSPFVAFGDSFRSSSSCSLSEAETESDFLSAFIFSWISGQDEYSLCFRIQDYFSLFAPHLSYGVLLTAGSLPCSLRVVGFSVDTLKVIPASPLTVGDSYAMHRFAFHKH